MKRAVQGLLALVVVVIVATGGFVAATWAPDRNVDELKARWATPPSQFITVNGMQVHFRDEGPREDPLPIVLLHGTSASLHTWDGWTQELAKTRRVIRFDMPGFGLTGPAPDNDYRLEAYVRFVAGVADALGVQEFTLGGNSLGGRIAWGVAVAHPERVKKLVLVDAGGYPVHDNDMPIAFRIAQMPGLNRLMEVTLPRSMVEDSVRDVYGDPAKVTPELVDRYYDLTLRAGNRAALRERFAQQDLVTDYSAEIRTIRQPTLVLWGGRDRLLVPADAGRFGKDIPGSQVVLFETLGHVPHEEDPAATLVPVLQFL
ncbi:MAG: alpha/beta hydrolase [Moraxellaceae bacterium]|jgi:pimeloyl-ACP methyl ester carboxylesterase|nr:alpha/beta hydrolase [Moraxellaceae bacterium]